MMDVAAERIAIRDTERDYVAEWHALNGDLRSLPGQGEYQHPNRFASLHDWKAYFDEHLATHMEAYGYLRDLYRPLIHALEAAPLPRESISPTVTYDERQQQPALVQQKEGEIGRDVDNVTGEQPRPKQSLWAKVRPALHNPWVVTVGSGLIVGLVVALGR